MTSDFTHVNMKEYMNTFTGGGWNTVFANTLEEAVESAVLEWKDVKFCVVNEDSVRLANKDELAQHMSLFH